MSNLSEKIIREYCEDYLESAYGGRYYYIINIETRISFKGEKSYSLRISPKSFISKRVYKNLLRYLQNNERLIGYDLTIDTDPNHPISLHLDIRPESLFTTRNKKIKKILNRTKL